MSSMRSVKNPMCIRLLYCISVPPLFRRRQRQLAASLHLSAPSPYWPGGFRERTAGHSGCLFRRQSKNAAETSNIVSAAGIQHGFISFEPAAVLLTEYGKQDIQDELHADAGMKTGAPAKFLMSRTGRPRVQVSMSGFDPSPVTRMAGTPFDFRMVLQPTRLCADHDRKRRGQYPRLPYCSFPRFPDRILWPGRDVC